MKPTYKFFLFSLLFLFSLSFSTQRILGLSIAELTTEQLIAESPYIILGYVSESLNLEDDPDFPSAEHTVTVIHSYRGDLEKNKNITVRESLGGTSNIRSDYPAILFLMPSFRNPEHYATVNNFQGLVELDSEGNFIGYGLFDTYTLSELEAIFLEHEEVFDLNRSRYPGERIVDFSPSQRRRIKLRGIFEGLSIIIEWDAAEQKLYIKH
ncbi:hypothetical protein SAMN05192551_10582 [Tindallia magadiensis]|uniref:Uncharacterized protein n=1 Tax=Tindallia magadiensis TaxID=69895 RepID=A0A1I3EN91_9FIRM|nr:hypothetical protein [Tindallia magadiensis]SFI00419.1 hypothetical protein SAMN05192551_10582 [Tindallia magadiensis]